MISKEINLWVIPSFYWSEDYPLRGVFFREQAEAIANIGVKTTIIYPELRTLRDFSIFKLRNFHFQRTVTSENNLIVHRKKRWNFFPTNSPSYNLGLKIWVKEVLKIAKRRIESGDIPDLIHAHCCLGAGIAAFKIFEEYDIPYLITEHSTSFHESIFNNDTTDILKKSIENSSKTFAVSSPLRNAMISKLGLNCNSVEIMPNFIDTDFFVPDSNIKQNSGKNTFRFLTISGINERKKIDRTIIAFEKLYKVNNNVELYIGGENQGKEFELKTLVSNLGLNKSVKFIGSLSRDSVLKNMQGSNCFVLASEAETFGVVLIESMSCGIPVIATKSGGPEDIITKECGLLVEKNVNDLFIAMEYMINNIKTYDRGAIREIVIKKFSKDIISHQYLSIYRLITG